MREIVDYGVREVLLEDERFVLYRARDVNTEVLLKVARDNATPDDLSALSSDFLNARRFNIPAIPRPLLIETAAGGGTFQVRQYVPGRPLSLWVDGQRPRPSLTEVVEFGLLLLRALEPLHLRGIAHCDLSPRNLLYDPDSPAIFFADCAWARGYGVPGRRRSGQITPYLAPEQLLDEHQVIDARADLYAIGVILHQLYTGELPPDGLPTSDGEPIIAGPLSRVLTGLLHPQRNQRYASVGVACRALARCLDDWRGHASTPEPEREVEAGNTVRQPDELFGRHEVRRSLDEALADAARGEPTLVLLTGDAGSGKSTLLGDLRRKARASGALILSGGWGLFDRGTPFRGFVSVCEELTEFLSTLEDAERRKEIDELRRVLGESCGVVTEAFPALESVLGIHPRPAPVGTIERQNRLTYCFTTMLAALGSSGRPLVLLLEDLHWADGASLLMLERLPGRGALRHLLTVGTVRTGEDGADLSVVAEMEAAAVARGQTVRSLVVPPFQQEEARSFLAAALDAPAETMDELAEVLADMSMGNPLALRELLAETAANGLVEFDGAQGRWVWRTEEIRHSYVPEDVARLFVSQMSSLPEPARDALRAAACLGSKFEASVVAGLLDRSAAEVELALQTCVSKGLVVSLPGAALEGPSGPLFAFRHERIQGAAYNALTAEGKERFHALRGAALLAIHEQTGPPELIFEALNHLNRSHALRAAKEDPTLAQLNFRAALLAKRATAYQTAALLLENMHGQLPSSTWAWNPDLAFDSALLQAECSFLCKQADVAEGIYADLLGRVDDPQRRIVVLMARSQMLNSIGRFAESIVDGIECLKLLGVTLPVAPRRIQVLLPMVRMLASHRRLAASPAELSLSALDSTTNQIMACLAELWGPAFWVSENLTGLVVFAMVRVSLSRGNSAASSLGYGSYGAFLAMALKKNQLGRDVCRIGVALAEKAAAPLYLGRTRFIYEAFFGCYERPLREAPTMFREIASGCLRAGDYSYAGAAANMFLYYLPVVGTPLSDFRVQARDIVGVARQTDQSRTLLTVEILDRWIAIVEGREKYSAPTFVNAQPSSDRRGSENEAGVYHLFEISLLYFVENYEAATPHVEFMPGNKMLGGYFAGYYAFFAALVTAKQGDAHRNDRRWLARFRRYRRVIEKDAARFPPNYRHMTLLLLAIEADATGRTMRAAQLFEESLQDARQQGFLPHAGIAAELFAEHLLRRGQTALAERQLGIARLSYHQWGCLTKVEAIDRKLTRLTEERSLSASGGHSEPAEVWPRNVAAVLQATRALSGETDPVRLAERLISSIMEHTRATRVVLLTREDVTLTVACERRATTVASPARMPGLPEDLPESVINYVDRMGRPVRLTASAEHDLFGRDPYMAAHAGVTLLCVPLVSMLQKLGVVFLEKEGPTSLRQSDLVTAEILAAQAAASLRNAREYNERLSALQNQMHPHFLFNALSGIAELTVADPGRAERAVLGLAALYRDILATSRQRAIPLAQELELVRSYLTLEKLRFGERLSFQIDVRGDATAALIPPLVLQPLVENSVNHGVALKPEGGTVRVTVTIAERRVHVRVSDDGAGWSHGGSGQGAGLGLKSIRRRLQLFFGAEADLTMSIAGPVTVDVFVPIRTNEQLKEV